MPSVANKLTGIVSNTRKVLELCTSLQSENDTLKLEMQALQVALETSLTMNKQFEAQLKALVVVKTLDGTEMQENGTDLTINEKILDTKRKINDFVQEIDKCIELLR